MVYEFVLTTLGSFGCFLDYQWSLIIGIGKRDFRWDFIGFFWGGFRTILFFSITFGWIGSWPHVVTSLFHDGECTRESSPNCWFWQQQFSGWWIVTEPARLVISTWWLIPLSKWVITPVINGISRVNPLIAPSLWKIIHFAVPLLSKYGLVVPGVFRYRVAPAHCR